MLANVPDTLQTFFAPQVEQLGLHEIHAEFGGLAKLPMDLGEGYLWVTGLCPYCLLSVHDFTLKEEVSLKEYPEDSFALSLMTANMAELAPIPSFPTKQENIVAFHQSNEEVCFTLPRNTRCHSTTLCFLPEYFEHLAAITDADPFELRLRFDQAAPNLLPSQMGSCLRSLTPDPKGNDETALRYTAVALKSLSLMTASASLPTTTPHKLELVHHAIAIMETRLATRFTLDDLADELFVSKSTLNRAFRQVKGKGPSEIMTRLRMEHATNLLLESDLAVSEIAHAVGFAHQSSFCDAYKRYYGISPLQTRNSRRLSRTQVHG